MIYHFSTSNSARNSFNFSCLFSFFKESIWERLWRCTQCGCDYHIYSFVWIFKLQSAVNKTGFTLENAYQCVHRFCNSAADAIHPSRCQCVLHAGCYRCFWHSTPCTSSTFWPCIQKAFRLLLNSVLGLSFLQMWGLCVGGEDMEGPVAVSQWCEHCRSLYRQLSNQGWLPFCTLPGKSGTCIDVSLPLGMHALYHSTLPPRNPPLLLRHRLVQV